MATLTLDGNQIGINGAQLTPSALRHNTVSFTAQLIYSALKNSHLIQTLTNLSIDNNQLGDQGAKHIARALQDNKAK